MKCPSCGKAKLVRRTRNIPYAYKGESTVIRAVKGDYCPACGEAVLGVAESTRTSAAMLEFNKWLNAHSEDIVEVDADQMRRIGKLVRGVKL